jgi:hypothetical protein
MLLVSFAHGVVVAPILLSFVGRANTDESVVTDDAATASTF